MVGNIEEIQSQIASRVVKFNAWHKEQEKMYLAAELGQDQMTLMPDGRGFVNISGDSTRLSQIDDGKRMVPLQYIGRTDCDGVEIYEGHLLEDHFWNSKWFTVIRVVEMPDIYGILDGHRCMKGSYYKIIGNIFETPGLLEEVK